MKNILTIILFAIMLIVSEYFLLNEAFTKRRFFVISICLAVTLGCIIAAHRYFKKNVITGKHTEAQG